MLAFAVYMPLLLVACGRAYFQASFGRAYGGVLSHGRKLRPHTIRPGFTGWLFAND